jgi:uncharacterized protein (TIGR00255 family)
MDNITYFSYISYLNHTSIGNMILSMTGYGRGEVQGKSFTVITEARSVNNRFLEVSLRAPKLISVREQEIKEIARRFLSRGKVNMTVSLESDNDGTASLSVNKASAKAHYRLLNQLRKILKLRETVKLEHVLQFSEIFDVDSDEALDDEEWDVVIRSVTMALQQLQEMREGEGRELSNDMLQRIDVIDSAVDFIESKSRERVPLERERLRERVQQILHADEIDERRLELELVLLSDKLDVTEECVRLRSHIKYFRESASGKDPSGRKLGFLLQEMHREINTIGSKASDSEISQKVIGLKEEVEKIREQIQNIE